MVDQVLEMERCSDGITKGNYWFMFPVSGGLAGWQLASQGLAGLGLAGRAVVGQKVAGCALAGGVLSNW